METTKLDYLKRPLRPQDKDYVDDTWRDDDIGLPTFFRNFRIR